MAKVLDNSGKERVAGARDKVIAAAMAANIKGEDTASVALKVFGDVRKASQVTAILKSVVKDNPRMAPVVNIDKAPRRKGAGRTKSEIDVDKHLATFAAMQAAAKAAASK